MLILTHHDADGLSSGALLSRALERAGRPCTVRLVGRGESAWTDPVRAETAGRDIGGLIVADLGVRGGSLGSAAPAVVIDHHVPTGAPEGATVISGYGQEPVPTTSLLAYRCAGQLDDVADLLWLAAVGLVGDLGDKAPFEELAAAKKVYTATAIREVVSLVNAPRRTASGDAAAALALLLAARDPKDALSGLYPERVALQAARDEVKLEVEAGKRVPPQVRGEIALISLDSPCQIHPLVAQAWRVRLRDKIVLAANTGFRPGWVHFAARTATGRNLVDYLRGVAPPGADENYGGGHEQASGGALRLEDWPIFLANIGFPPAEASNHGTAGG
ncbi:MAG: DHH family phosphoesterase [Actinomycetospora chiangmaiensis]|nr:DHH family phosphoesterase [Actinomycetospora chiangmaiensis]